MTSPAPGRVFLLSPAHCGGRRARILLGDRADFPLAARLRRAQDVTLGEAFSFLSGLYFRGKLTYATRFAGGAPAGDAGILVITTNRGLLRADLPVTRADLAAFGETDIDAANPIYREPLERDVARVAGLAPREVVLLGSVATGKYVDILLDLLGDRLLFPIDFVGRGDMSRGALLLRAAAAGIELAYHPVAGAIRRGPRAARIDSRRTAERRPAATGAVFDRSDPEHSPEPK